MTIFIFLLVLLVLIVVHEFGHFIVAKKSGIRVDEFGVGFPPKLFGKKFGETEYTVNALPFGGFVRIFGENPDEDSLRGPDSARAMVHKPKLIQAAVLFAGVFFNMLLAWIIFSGVLMVGTPAVSGAYDQYLSDEKLIVTQVLPGSPAEQSGLVAGDEILSLTLRGEQVVPATPNDVSTLIGGSSGEATVLTVQRGASTEEVVVRAETGLISEAPEQLAIGVGMGLVGTLTLPVHLAILEGGKQTIEMLSLIMVGLGSFLADAALLKADLSTIAGPVGIVSLVGDASALGIIALLNFTALISLNLAVINLLPFPALDGGRLLFLLVETLKGSPIRPQVAHIANSVGFALLILLMLVVTFSDVARLVG